MLPRWRYIPAPASRFTTQTDTIRHRALWMTKRSGRVGAGVAIALSIAFPAAAQTGQSASGYKAPVISDTGRLQGPRQDRKSTRLNSSHVAISYAVFCLKK